MDVGSIISNGIQKGFQNLLPLLVNFVLWALTVWIPYLNVGTTICLFAALPIKMSKGETISYTEIFNPIYRKRMGEVFITWFFVGSGVFLGMLFLIVPAFVIGIAWMLAVLLVIDKEKNPMEAIAESNRLTYGKKWTIFGGMFLLWLLIFVASAIAGYILQLIGKIPVIGGLINVAGMILIGGASASIFIGATGYIYGELVRK